VTEGSAIAGAWRSARKFLGEVLHVASRVQLATHAAALSAYALLSLVPLLLFGLELIARFFPNPDANAELLKSVEAFAGPQVARFVGWIGALEPAARARSGGRWAELAILAFAAMSIFLQGRRSMVAIFGRPEGTRPRILWRAVRGYLLAFSMVLVTAALFISLLFANAAIVFIETEVLPAARADVPLSSLRAVHFAVSLVLVTMMIGLSWRVLSARRPPRPFAYPAAFITAIFAAFGNGIVGRIIAHSSMKSYYGAAWSIIAIVIWVQYSALIYLLGAVVTRVLWDRASTSGDPPPSPAA